jgi:hypothetical protein
VVAESAAPGAREARIGEWTVAQVIPKKEEPLEEDVKKEEEETKVGAAGSIAGSDGGRRERARTPDEEDLWRFKVKEKTFPVDVKDEEDVKIAAVGFKKRKIGAKNSRVSGAL